MLKKQRFYLKDSLFNKAKVQKISDEITGVYSTFKAQEFQTKVLRKFPDLELLERVYWIRDCLREYLPDDYRTAVRILLKSLPPSANPLLTDNDFGDFIYAPYGYFVAEYGCTVKDLQFSLKALQELTTRFSVEASIRFFINTFPKETMQELQKWSKDSHYHVRRAASEGTRPKLPWAKQIEIDFRETISILDELHADKTRFVTRSVANHVNDISKIDSETAIKLLKKWKKDKFQTEKELQYLTVHSLRTLVKKGNKEALAMLGYNDSKIVVKNFKVGTSRVKIGDTLEFSFDIISESEDTQQLMIDYLLYFNKASGKCLPKVFKIAKKKLTGKEVLKIRKKHPLRVMTTRTLHLGTHEIELQINGQSFGKQSFALV